MVCSASMENADVASGQVGQASGPTTRSAWKAALLGLISPGLGNLYAGQPGIAVGGVCAYAALEGGIVFAWCAHPVRSVVPLIAVILVAVAFVATTAVLAVRGARRWASERPLAGYQRKLVYVAWALGLIVAINLFRAHMVQPFRTPSRSMSPTVQEGDAFYVIETAAGRDPKRGAIVVFHAPRRSIAFVKRVVGLPGDTVQVREDAVTVNGAKIRSLSEEPYLVGTWHVPTGSLFVLGDSLKDSEDSRQFGSVPLANLIGTARLIYWSHGPEGVRWDRIGLAL